ncbi:LytR C-terminal domain-containing protein [Nocardia donostiensis]|uniref:Glycoprotein n=1 Tax=Nocardia donostiensis TaxID=1538463 RepID=A0A1W0BPA5_9NOCA|nr:LytR C-terminal domain-containing protein [Nocardia donostiensis]ONM47602.1 glycoprotein [Nocardia donostiensis]OQS15053.1 glycoprotein [Nocardia donostiensis]OQS24226.1 glycoprotein [Nocardia donostiensis]
MSNSNPTSGGPPLRALAMVLISLAIVFAGLGAMSLSSAKSDTAEAADSETSSETAAPQVTAAATTRAGAGTTTSAGATATSSAQTTPGKATTTAADGVDRSVPVQVLNNSLVAGLAARTADELGAEGWTNTSTGNYAGSTLAETTVYYGDGAGDKEAAEAIAAELGAKAAPNPGIGDSSTGVTVIVTGE